MISMTVVLATSALLLAPCSANGRAVSSEDAISPSEVVADADALDGRTVRIREWFQLAPEEYQIWDTMESVSFAESEARASS